jgi:hypothetical protein
MPWQTAATSLAPARTLRRTANDGVLHRDVKRVVVAIRLRILQRALVF